MIDTFNKLKSIPLVRYCLYFSMYVLYIIPVIDFLMSKGTLVSLDSMFFYTNNEPNEFDAIGSILIMVICGDYLFQDSLKRDNTKSLFIRGDSREIVFTLLSCVLVAFTVIILQFVSIIVASLIAGTNPLIITDGSLFITSFFIVLLRISVLVQIVLLLNVLFMRFIGLFVFLFLSICDYVLYIYASIIFTSLPKFLWFEHAIIVYNPSFLPMFERPDYWVSFAYWFAIMLMVFFASKFYSYKTRTTEKRHD